ncbi:hypothetical protein A7M48_18745 [Acinetobacter baumannii]|nr:hypothetical protein A7M48_18745 [Acinetobacter baumannii]
MSASETERDAASIKRKTTTTQEEVTVKLKQLEVNRRRRAKGVCDAVSIGRLQKTEAERCWRFRI